MTDKLDTTAIRAKAKTWHLPARIADDILALCDALDAAQAENQRRPISEFTTDRFEMETDHDH